MTAARRSRDDVLMAKRIETTPTEPVAAEQAPEPTPIYHTTSELVAALHLEEDYHLGKVVELLAALGIGQLVGDARLAALAEIGHHVSMAA